MNESTELLGHVPEVLREGDLLEFETVKGVRGSGVVLSVSDEPYLARYPYYVRWDDENGKHYERFGLECFRNIRGIGVRHSELTCRIPVSGLSLGVRHA